MSVSAYPLIDRAEYFHPRIMGKPFQKLLCMFMFLIAAVIDKQLPFSTVLTQNGIGHLFKERYGGIPNIAENGDPERKNSSRMFS